MPQPWDSPAAPRSLPISLICLRPMRYLRMWESSSLGAAAGRLQTAHLSPGSCLSPGMGMVQGVQSCSPGPGVAAGSENGFPVVKQFAYSK